LIEGISEGYKADESEKQATSNLMSQRNSTIALRQRQQQKSFYYRQRRYSQAVLSTVDPAEIAERRRLKAEQDTQALDRVIDSITIGMSRKAFNSRLKALARISLKNITTICDHILAEQTEMNIKPSTAESKVKLLIWLSKYHDHKPFEDMTKQDIVNYLNSNRKPVSIDPQQRWIGSYNGRLRYLLKFFRWLHNKDEPDYRKRPTPQCIQGLRILPRQEKTAYKPTDLWDSREHTVFLKYCPSVRDRCYHAMANDMSARPHEILNLKIKDIVFKITEEGMYYAEVLIRGGKTKPRTLPLVDCIPYLKDWLLQHPTADNRDSWLFVSLDHRFFGRKLKRDSLLAKYQYQYKALLFPRLLQDETVPGADKAIIRNMLTKPWNLYVYRHSALTEKSQILTESTLRDHAGWTMTSKMPSVYVHYFGTESARKLLETKGIFKQGQKDTGIPKPKNCPNCGEPNKQDTRFCIKCRMVLSYDVYSETTKKEKVNTDVIAALSDQIVSLTKEIEALKNSRNPSQPG
jgi:integrase